jgi:integrase
MQMIRAITLAWLFSGLRSDEIARLRVGCVRWQHDGMPIPGDSGEVLARDAVCLLDIPAHKTGTAFTKPVDPLLGKAIEAWQSIRPAQPKMPDRKTGEGDHDRRNPESNACGHRQMQVKRVGARLSDPNPRIARRAEPVFGK